MMLQGYPALKILDLGKFFSVQELIIVKTPGVSAKIKMSRLWEVFIVTAMPEFGPQKTGTLRLNATGGCRRQCGGGRRLQRLIKGETSSAVMRGRFTK